MWVLKHTHATSTSATPSQQYCTRTCAMPMASTTGDPGNEVHTRPAADIFHVLGSTSDEITSDGAATSAAHDHMAMERYVGNGLSLGGAVGGKSPRPMACAARMRRCRTPRQRSHTRVYHLAMAREISVWASPVFAASRRRDGEAFATFHWPARTSASSLSIGQAA